MFEHICYISHTKALLYTLQLAHICLTYLSAYIQFPRLIVYVLLFSFQTNCCSGSSRIQIKRTNNLKAMQEFNTLKWAKNFNEKHDKLKEIKYKKWSRQHHSTGKYPVPYWASCREYNNNNYLRVRPYNWYKINKFIRILFIVQMGSWKILFIKKILLGSWIEQNYKTCVLFLFIIIPSIHIFPQGKTSQQMLPEKFAYLGAAPKIKFTGKQQTTNRDVSLRLMYAT